MEGVSIGGGYNGGADGTVVDRGREEILVDCGVELVNGRDAGTVDWDSGGLEVLAASSLAWRFWTLRVSDSTLIVSFFFSFNILNLVE